MNERIKELRQALGLTLKEFGDQIGMSLSGVHVIEIGKANVTDRTINLICRTLWNGQYRVSEQWLRTGEGEMLLEQTEEEEIALAVGRVLADDVTGLRRALLLEIARTPPETWDKIEAVLRRLIKKEPD